MESTKERITYAALQLFAEKGYQTVTVKEIADKVNIKAPSLYKHFKNKQEIFTSCKDLFYHRMHEVHDQLHMPDSTRPAFAYQSATTQKIIEIAENLFEFYLTDEVAANFRKILLIERYHNKELNQMYEEIFIDGAIDYEEKVFAELVEQGAFKKTEPHLLAIKFYAPIYFLIQKYEQRTESIEEGKEALKQVIIEFCQLYSNKEG
ncbi:TetR/AcrR family transcriptional regulator [Fundicoccus culcitae]|uniref:TetR/AcrR family transcriptional regulator n=1 Tax=Fundicoccus culcitae TaxID=2969821 RepID=A0ABY5P801_9LACT|nr:TetR/AcrR family transcriptional regulator [Fundicoccus culcitae]UUX34789.1 TetR/AcrR family transcriptional regulator [Fundicoccus culcitae]